MAIKDTPVVEQYKEIKKQYQDCILFFRMGDFYETFENDARITSKVLDIALTSRDRGEEKRPMAGIPYHALMTYLPRLIRAGYKVAICEQMENPKETKGVVKREVVRVITPGTVLEAEIQDPKQNTYILSLFIKGNIIGLAYMDVSKGTFTIFETSDMRKAIDIMVNIHPVEVILPENYLPVFETYPEIAAAFHDCTLTYVPLYDFSQGESFLTRHFNTVTLKGFIREGMSCSVLAGGALLKYVESSQKHEVLNIEKIEELQFDERMYLDPSTLANLEILSSMGGPSLLDVIDKTRTSMGARLLRDLLVYPLIQKKDVQKRLDAVSCFKQDKRYKQVREVLAHISDIERINARISYTAASPRDFLSLSVSLENFCDLCRLVRSYADIPDSINAMVDEQAITQAQKIISLITQYIDEQAGQTLANGDVIRRGIDSELDELKELLKGGKGWIKGFQEQEIKRTGINSLKVHYNKVFGYYIEISNVHKTKIPSDYIRKQTLVNSERYITQQLKDKEDLILNAQDTIVSIENRIFSEFKTIMLAHVSPLKKIAERVAYLDVFSNFAYIADTYGYVKPVISDDKVQKPLTIKGGRHPVIEQSMDSMSYIPNDVHLDCAKDQILLITGPNMAGKSSILRMVALISLMMQIGSFVPADEATLFLVDRIFSRVGARDSLATGESTFMVEMHETANILHNANENSLIILDEIGRGTSTYDGVSIAYAVIEYIHEYIHAKTMFATHYHELIDMEHMYKRLKNFNVQVKESHETIVFLRKLQPGGTDKSYGIHVAKLAGIPKEVLRRANFVLKEYEKIKEEIRRADIPPLLSMLQDYPEAAEDIGKIKQDESLQKIRELLEGVDLNTLTPLEGLNKLHEIYKQIIHDNDTV